MTLKLNGSSSGSVSIDAPASTTGGADLTYTLPNATTGGIIRTTTTPGAILQVQNTTYTAQASVSLSSANTWYNISQINVTITPAAASSKFLINVMASGETNYSPHDFSLKLVRTVGGSGTDIAIGDADGSNLRCTGAWPPGYHGDDNDTTAGNFTIPNYLDSPNTTSAITYGLYIYCHAASKTLFLNGVVNQGSDDAYENTPSWMTVMEVAG